MISEGISSLTVTLLLAIMMFLRFLPVTVMVSSFVRLISILRTSFEEDLSVCTNLSYLQHNISLSVSGVIPDIIGKRFLWVEYGRSKVILTFLLKVASSISKDLPNMSQTIAP